jgi:hypothetical protein
VSSKLTTPEVRICSMCDAPFDTNWAYLKCGKCRVAARPKTSCSVCGRPISKRSERCRDCNCISSGWANPTVVELSWAVGLFEGEGSIVKRTGRSDWRLSVQMTDEDVVRRFHGIVGIGTVVASSARKSTHKDSWIWSSSRRADVVDFLRHTLPLMGQRRASKASQALSELTNEMESDP